MQDGGSPPPSLALMTDLNLFHWLTFAAQKQPSNQCFTRLLTRTVKVFAVSKIQANHDTRKHLQVERCGSHHFCKSAFEKSLTSSWLICHRFIFTSSIIAEEVSGLHAVTTSGTTRTISAGAFSPVSSYFYYILPMGIGRTLWNSYKQRF